MRHSENLSTCGPNPPARWRKRNPRSSRIGGWRGRREEGAAEACLAWCGDSETRQRSIHQLANFRSSTLEGDPVAAGEVRHMVHDRKLAHDQDGAVCAEVERI